MKVYHWFIPNRKNRFHPTALQPTGLIIFLAVFIAIPLIYNLSTSREFRVLGYATSINASELLSLSNQERINNGLSPLNLNSSLNSAAQAKANDMFSDNYWAHVAPDGTSPWSFILASGYQYTAAGENLAKDFSFSSGVVSGWMASPTHKANVLNSNYKDVGFAVVNGTLLGSQTTLVVAMYGAKVEPVVASATPAPTTPVQAPTTSQPANNKTADPNLAPKTTNSSSSPTATTMNIQNTDNTGVAASDKSNTTINKNVDNTQYNAGEVLSASVSWPIRTYNSLNWGQKVSLLLMSTLILLFSLKHTVIWRQKKRGYKHIWLRAHPLGQMAILTAVLVITLIGGAGVVL